MQATLPPPESPNWGIHQNTKSFFDSNHDGIRALMIVLFYGGLFILYGVVTLAKKITALVRPAFRPWRKDVPPAVPKWQSGL